MVPQPIIPGELYDKCILAWNNAEESIAILAQLAPLYRLLLIYAIRFLQVSLSLDAPQRTMHSGVPRLFWLEHLSRRLVDVLREV